MTIDFHMDELAVVVPDGAVDKTTNLLEWSIDGEAVQLTVQRDNSRQRLSPSQLLHATRAEYEKRFPLFQPEEAPTFEVQLDHAAAAFTWKKDHKAAYQVQVFLDLGARVMIFTATGRPKHRQEIADLLKKTIESISVRR